MSAVHTLVIAYGNPLRGDDGVGFAAADIVASWQMPGVKVCALHQLVPELIEEMKQAERILFIDAAMDIADGPFESRIVEPAQARRVLGHHETPANLLALLRELEGRAPEAWLVTIAACSFDHGAEMTDRVQDNLRSALVWIRVFLSLHAV